MDDRIITILSYIFQFKFQICPSDVLRGGGAQVRVPHQRVHGRGLRRRRRRQVRHHAEHLILTQGENDLRENIHFARLNQEMAVVAITFAFRIQ